MKGEKKCFQNSNTVHLCKVKMHTRAHFCTVVPDNHLKTKRNAL